MTKEEIESGLESMGIARLCRDKNQYFRAWFRYVDVYDTFDEARWINDDIVWNYIFGEIKWGEVDWVFVEETLRKFDELDIDEELIL